MEEYIMIYRGDQAALATASPALSAMVPTTSTELVAMSRARRSSYDLRDLNALVAIDDRRRLVLR